MTGNRKRRPDITVTLKCNNRCTFCPRTILSHVAVKTTEGLEERLNIVRKEGHRVVLTGGEVTLLEDFFSIIDQCRKLGFKEIAIITNGRRFSDAEFARRTLDSGVTEICVTLYDLRSSVHDAMTNVKGSFKETMAGLENILAVTKPISGPMVRINTILCSKNADGMVSLVENMASRRIPSILIADAVLSESFPEPLPYSRVRNIVGRILERKSIGGSSLVLRGFPLCIFEGLESVLIEGNDFPGSVRVECQNIDTTFSRGDEIEKYFSEFFSSFERVDACMTCPENIRCPGVQKFYLQSFGSGEFSPLGRNVSAARENRFEEREDPARIAVTPTTACQLRCSYCMVKLGRKRASPEVLDRAADLLLTSSSSRPELQFFGGEPLLKPELVKETMKRASRRFKSAGKEILFTITTNGILLDAEILEFLKEFNVRVLFSMDGDFETQNMCRFKGKKNGRKLQLTMERNLEALMKSSLPYFINMVVAPETVTFMQRNFDYFLSKGVGLMQVCYANGIAWKDSEMEAFCSALEGMAERALQVRRAGGRFRLQNVGSKVEPTILSNDLLVDVDGMLYGDAAIFCEKALPGLRRPYRIGHVEKLQGLDGLRKSKKENLQLLRRFYPATSPVRMMIEKQIQFGMMVDTVLKKAEEAESEIGTGASRQEPRIEPAQPARVYSDSNPLLTRVLTRSLKDQMRFMEQHPSIMKLPVLLIENECYHDCIFCKRKPIAPTPMERIENILKENETMGAVKLGLIGNEPLAHPEILKILETARRCGFREFEVLTSGQPMSNPDFTRSLMEAGVRRFSIPLYSYDAREHDEITRSQGSHRSTLEGVRNIRKEGGEVFMHANLLKQNISGIDRLARFVKDSLELPFCIIPVRPKMANLPYGELAPSYKQMVDLLPGKVDRLVGFPICVVEKIQSPALIPSSVISDLLKLYLLDQKYYKPPSSCNDCPKTRNCTGSYREHIRIYGEELLP